MPCSSAGDDLADAIRRPGPVAVPGFGKVLQAFAVAIAIYGVVGLVFGFDGKSVQAIALGMILIFGVAYLLAQATFPLWASHPAAAGIRVHLSNGLYANAIFDRLLGGWSKRSAT